ncbi:MAG: polysaccharide deacetylase family protein [Bacteroidota bacterium]
MIRKVITRLRGMYDAQLFRTNKARYTHHCRVLMYHHIRHSANYGVELTVTPEHFGRQMEHLKKHKIVLTAGEFFSIRESKDRFPENSVLITFDDGYYNNLSNALPVLESTGLEASFFITTDHIDTPQLFWWELLYQAAAVLLNENRTVRDIFTGKPVLFTARTLRQWEAALKNYPANQINAMVLRFLKDCGIDPATLVNDDNRSLTRAELNQLTASKSAYIGAHTCSHTRLSVLPYDEQYRELGDSKHMLEQWTGKPVNTFSYPFGTRTDYNRDTQNALTNLGYRYAFSTTPNVVIPGTAPLAIPRLLAPDSFEEFKRLLH